MLVETNFLEVSGRYSKLDDNWLNSNHRSPRKDKKRKTGLIHSKVSQIFGIFKSKEKEPVPTDEEWSKLKRHYLEALQIRADVQPNNAKANNQQKEPQQQPQQLSSFPSSQSTRRRKITPPANFKKGEITEYKYVSTCVEVTLGRLVIRKYIPRLIRIEEDETEFNCIEL